MNFLISAGRGLHCSAPSFRLGVAAPAQPEAARRASQSEAWGAPNAEAGFLSKAVKHHWYGDTSPWTEQRLEDAYGFGGARSRPAEEVVILDQENPPQPPSVRTVESED